MGLRQLKIARTRAQIVEVAVDLFLTQGYEATTMEQVAELAEVGSSTLYRYFPSKELLVLEPITRALDFASRLAARPEDEPLDVALGSVIRAAFPGDAVDGNRFVALRRLVDQTPGPRARLWALVNQAATDLERVVAARTDRKVGDLQVALTARLAFAVYALVGETLPSARSRASWNRTVDRVLTELGKIEVVIPR